MHKTISTTLVAGQLQTPPTYVPGRLMGVLIDLEVASVLRIAVDIDGIANCGVLGGDYNVNTNPGQFYLPFAEDLPFGGLTYRIGVSVAQTTNRPAVFVYTEVP